MELQLGQELALEIIKRLEPMCVVDEHGKPYIEVAGSDPALQRICQGYRYRSDPPRLVGDLPLCSENGARPSCTALKSNV